MKQYGFTHLVIIRRKTGPENLLVIRFCRTEVTDNAQCGYAETDKQ